MNETLAVETIQVEVVGKFGVKAGEVWYGLGKELSLDQFARGDSYTVGVATAKSGKKYIREILSGSAPLVASAPVAPAAAVVAAPVVKAAYKPFNKFGGGAKKDSGATMSKEEWQAKDRSQLIGGLSHDAAAMVQAHVQSMKPMDDLLSLYEQALGGLLVIRERIK